MCKENKTLVFKSNVWFSHLGSGPVNILATGNWARRVLAIVSSYSCHISVAKSGPQVDPW